MSWPAAGNYPLNRLALNTREEYVRMLARTHTRTFGACGAWTLLGEAYSATPLVGGFGSHPPTLNLPQRTAADHHLPRVPLNNGLSDGLHAARTVTNFLSRLGFTARDVTIFNLSI